MPRQATPPQKPVFSRLDASGRFHRDSPIGRMFHPGTVSYREVSANDSLHIAVAPENRVSVHVDRVSPLALGRGRRHSYSFLGVMRHNGTHAIDSVARLLRGRRGDHRCQLDCGVVAVADGDGDAVRGPVMYEFSCRAAGAAGCRWKARAASEEELLAKVVEHARTVHGLNSMSDTVRNYARVVARRSS